MVAVTTGLVDQVGQPIQVGDVVATAEVMEDHNVMGDILLYTTLSVVDRCVAGESGWYYWFGHRVTVNVTGDGDRHFSSGHAGYHGAFPERMGRYSVRRNVEFFRGAPVVIGMLSDGVTVNDNPALSDDREGTNGVCGVDMLGRWVRAGDLVAVPYVQVTDIGEEIPSVEVVLQQSD